MSETERMTPLEAARAIREMEGMDERLKRRIFGLLWLFWSVASAGLFLTYSYAASVAAAQAPVEFPPWFGLLWTPWAGVGLLFSVLLARTVGLVLPGEGLTAREIALHAGLFLLATIGLVVASFPTDSWLYPPTLVLLGLGLVTSVLGAREAVAGGRVEGAVQAIVGIALMAFAVTEAVLFRGEFSYATLSKAALWNVGASAIGLGIIGLFRTLRA